MSGRASRPPVGEDDDRLLLRRRAERLRRPLRPAAAIPSAENGLLRVRVGTRTCAVGTRWVREVMRGLQVSAVPLAPPALIGAAFVSSAVVPVIDLSQILGVAPRQAPPDLLICLGEGRPALALAVDEVLDVVARPPGRSQEIGEAPFRLLVLDDGTAILDGELLARHPERLIPGTPASPEKPQRNEPA